MGKDQYGGHADRKGGNKEAQEKGGPDKKIEGLAVVKRNIRALQLDSFVNYLNNDGSDQ